MADPGDKKTLDEWGNIVGATKRTLARLFRQETCMSLGQWRQQVRVMEALRRLGMWEPVTTVAIELGYDTECIYLNVQKECWRDSGALS